MANKIVKLGEKANSFYDPTTGLTLIPNEVKEVPNSFLRSQRARRFLKGGGIAYASKDELIEWQEAQKAKVKKMNFNQSSVDLSNKVKESEKTDEPDTEVEELKKMTKAALIDYVKGLDWTEDDVEEAKSITKKADLIEFIRETEEEYEKEE